ncbi:DUF6377 domain-containing protein [Sphingobacterium faecale]|uniref:DUF6377 domain-containing protein n=1 Tax=Sphingobacterium faecale TaxID=2803775 RepID=A0ABS1R1A2_9SPHI|nr:DUF6377 domain-containing protein [Sphingobacterium faecale]MBL1408438.1 hypothetical protein [Sphingobacterium faecale]
MKNWIVLSPALMISIFFFACNGTSSSPSLDSLKLVVDNREYYLEKKLKQIDAIRNKLYSSSDPLIQFNECRSLFKIYYDLQIDSALNYARRMQSISETTLNVNPFYHTEALFLIARVYTYSGMYKESSHLLAHAHANAGLLPDNLKQLYFEIQMQLYKGLADQSISTVDLAAYRKVISDNRDSLIAIVPKKSIWYYVHLSNKLKADQNYDQAVDILCKAYNQLTTADRDMAHVAFYMSDLYRLKGDVQREKEYLAVSSISDMKHAVKEYISLWKLGTVLYDEGDVKTAYQFIDISLQDAIYSGAYRWKQSIIKILPNIYTRYHATILQQKNTISSAFLVIAFLLTCSVFLCIYIVRQYKKLDNAKGELIRVNSDLKQLNIELNSLSEKLYSTNTELQINNSKLVFLNSELIGANRLKETYLSKFIDLCSDYIDKLDAYRGSLKRLLKSGKVEKIEQELESTKYVEKEHKWFLINFDETFLNLYPDFVSEFNSLFPKEDQQGIKSSELLSTELRVFALIRLGITDSNKIAKFLRCSVATIYTYRSRSKNKSYYRDDFEERIKGSHKHLS